MYRRRWRAEADAEVETTEAAEAETTEAETARYPRMYPENPTRR
jgi:hypothetical protein